MILRADWVYPVTSPPIRDGFVELRDGVIARFGSASHLTGHGSTTDLGHALLLPGLVNPHTHLELGCYQGDLAPVPFWEWLQRLIELRAAAGAADRERAAVTDGAWESLRAGVTCVGDISRTNIAWRILKPLPIRKVCFAELLSLASAPPRDPDELRSACDAIEHDDLLTAGVSPHAPYTVLPAHAQAAVAFAAERGRPWTMHLAETSEEVEFLRAGPAGLPDPLRSMIETRDFGSWRGSPGEYVSRLNTQHGGALVHMNYLEDDDIDRLRTGPHGVVYCPRAHQFFGHPVHPLPRLLAGGVRVAIGTDSLASNDSLSILDELHFVRHQVESNLPPERLLRMGTLDAAEMLGLGDRIGSIEAGKQADLAAFPCDGKCADPLADLLDTPRPALTVFVAGCEISLLA